MLLFHEVERNRLISVQIPEKKMSVFQSQSGTRSFPFILPLRLSFSLSASSARRPLSSMSLRLTNCTSLSFDYTCKSSLSRLRRIYQEATSPFEENIAAQRWDDARPKQEGWHYNDFQNSLSLCWWRHTMTTTILNKGTLQSKDGHLSFDWYLIK